jgi:mutator family transposase
VQEAYVNGVSTRKVDRLVEALGLAGISKDQVSRLCRELDERVAAFRERPLEGAYPYLWLDTKVEKVRDGGRVQRKALVVAYGVHEKGIREVLAIDAGPAETEAFWREFLRGLAKRGLAGVQLVVSDAHEGLKAAIAQVLGCLAALHRPLPARDARPRPKDAQGIVAAAIRPIFNAPDETEARQLLGETVERLERPSPKGRADARRRRRRPARLLRLPLLAPLEAALDESARAGQPRDRPPQRRRRHLPQRPSADPTRRRAADRTERRLVVTRRYLRLDGRAADCAGREEEKETQSTKELQAA